MVEGRLAPTLVLALVRSAGEKVAAADGRRGSKEESWKCESDSLAPQSGEG
jgi:hypothetical protein